MTSAARVLISGYYGFANAGDEAILAGLLEGLRRSTPHAELTVLSGDPAGTEAEHGVRAVPRGLRSAFAHLRQSDLLISGGGGLLQDATSWRSPLYYLALLRQARVQRVPAACLGHSIGPLRRRWVRWLARRELSRVELIALRDRHSQQALRSLGVTRAAEVSADLAFLLAPPSEAQIASAWQTADLARGREGRLGLALRQLPGEPKTRLASGLAASISAACQEVGARPVFVPMQRPRDVAFAEEMAGHMPLPTEIVRSRLTARELLALIAGFDLVVAMRLHALIFAALSGRPMVAISYDPKVEGLMAELGLSAAASAGNLDPAVLARSIVQAWQDREPLSQRVAARVHSLRSAARRNVELILPLLAGSS